ncbi:hypothetical protein BKE17_02745 [Enhydrobacter sp. H5]|nr:hypothetical protein BKE17_02745 [Enhydrobacter sp. H5]
MIGIAPMKDGGFGLVDLETGKILPGQMEVKFDGYKPGMQPPDLHVTFLVDWRNNGQGLPFALLDKDSNAHVVDSKKE